MRYFVEVVRQQSFTRAAEALFVTQPTISKMLRQLEEELAWTLGLIWREGSYLSRSAQAWIDCCREYWPGEAPTLSV